MSRVNLETYLNDHLAGSVMGIEMMTHLETVHAGTPLARALAEIRTEVLSDREELEALLVRLGIAVSPPRKMFAWLVEKLAELKLSLDSQAGSALHLFEALEAIALGTDGKQALWRTLLALQLPELEAQSLQRLVRRTQEQRERLEALRVQAAKAALQNDEAPG